MYLFSNTTSRRSRVIDNRKHGLATSATAARDSTAHYAQTDRNGLTARSLLNRRWRKPQIIHTLHSLPWLLELERWRGASHLGVSKRTDGLGHGDQGGVGCKLLVKFICKEDSSGPRDTRIILAVSRSASQSRSGSLVSHRKTMQLGLGSVSNHDQHGYTRNSLSQSFPFLVLCLRGKVPEKQSRPSESGGFPRSIPALPPAAHSPPPSVAGRAPHAAESPRVLGRAQEYAEAVGGRERSQALRPDSRTPRALGRGAGIVGGGLPERHGMKKSSQRAQVEMGMRGSEPRQQSQAQPAGRS